jgi:hypothetical protein
LKEFLSKLNDCKRLFAGTFFRAPLARLRFKRFIFLMPLMMLFGQHSLAQTEALKQQLLNMKAAADSSVKLNPAEKIYLQLDKSAYTPGDTICFKAYLFHAPTLGLSAKSGIMHIDIATDSSVIVKRIRVPVEEGLSWGNISLKTLPAGSYTLKAYTNWMLNFNEAGAFYKHFTIADDAGNNWLTNYTGKIVTVDGAERANVKLQLSDLNKVPVAAKPVQLYIMRGKWVLHKRAVQTDESGLIDVTFKLPSKASGLSVVARNENGNSVNIPLNITRPDDADVQFMPEGGNLIGGLPAHIGFKAIGLDGRGIDVKGVVLDNNKKQVADFLSSHLGMGSFNLEVKNKERYRAIVTLPGGFTREFALPDVKNSGTSLRVTDIPGTDSVNVSVYASDDIARSKNGFFLIGKARQTICYAATLNFNEGARVSKNISKKLFPTGVVHFILATAQSQTVNERLVFNNRHDNIHLNITTDKTVYATRDSVAMHIAAKDALGNPLAANFSLAVTDDAQVHNDPLNNENIISRIFLTSELKGYIEEPGYYFDVKNNQSAQALDNLLLTQGWVSYDWQVEKGDLSFSPEDEFAVKGRVVNAFNKPVKNAKVSLLSKSPLLVADTTTDNDGYFKFNNFPQIDTPAFVLKTAKNFNVNLLVDDPLPPRFATTLRPVQLPWYASSDSSLLAIVKNNRIKQNLADSLPAGGRVLREVKVVAKKIVKGSQNLNGDGEADQVFDEADMLKAEKKSLLQFLQEHIPSLKWGFLTNKYNLRFALQDKSLDEVNAIQQFTIVTPKDVIPWYMIDYKPMKLIVDGIPFGSVFKVMSPNEPDGNDIKHYLESYSAEDVKGIEVINSTKYSIAYFNRYIYPEWKNYLAASSMMFVEITTRSGSGPAIPRSPGAYLYKPLPLSLPAHFYSPRYAVNDKSKHTADLRSTIHWEPNLSTGADGKATVSFYTADKPSTYTYIIEGTNMDGSLGYIAGKIKVSNNTSP